MNVGDYVLATKYNDGDPHDHFCVGFWRKHTTHTPKRHDVIDGGGRLFRHNGFRRVQKITQAEGDWLVKNATEIENGCVSLWSHLSRIRREAKEVAA